MVLLFFDGRLIIYPGLCIMIIIINGNWGTIQMKVFKHRFLTLATVLLLTVVLAACGQNGNNAGNAANDAGAANNGATGNAQSGNGTNKAAEGQAATKIYKDFTGQEVEIPTDPQRIVSVTHLGDLLALGVKPIGAGSLALENSVLLNKELEGVESVGDISVEKVLELQPDLIIVPTYTPADIVEQLKKIAPVVTLATAGWEGIDPLEEVKTVGEMLGREQQAEEFITGISKKPKKRKPSSARSSVRTKPSAPIRSGRRASGYGRKPGMPVITCMKCSDSSRRRRSGKKYSRPRARTFPWRSFRNMPRITCS
ncbi:hypothetical protein HMSSN139_29360 [Paenibacillus sp. HMSSN-139]|nr:hypothetical protein HMSSN139_29360 [Paenibacillus sp. HMSSN-139]